MESLCGGKTNIDSVLVTHLKVLHLTNGDVLTVKRNFLRKQILGRRWITKVLPCLFHNVREVDKE